MNSATQNYNNFGINILGLDTIFQHCPDGVVCKDNDFRYLEINDTYCNIFSDCNKNSILGKNKNPYISDEIMNQIHDADTEVKMSNCPINYVLTDGKEKLLNIISFPILDDNNFWGIISFVRDITQEEFIKEQFVKKHFNYVDKEKHLQTQRETFVASIGHDLKNPTLAQIRGLELLLKGTFGDFSNEQKEMLEMILDSCRYMNGMLSSLLSTYRNYGGAIKLDFKEFSFNELLKECVSEMIYVAKEKGVNIILKEDDDFCVVCADKVQIKRVLMNLLSNGIKYAFKDTDLDLYTKFDSQNLTFHFENKSPYIPKDKQKTLFDRYVSYAGVHKELGNGLGLYASKKIIEGHNGNIFAKSFKDDRNIFGFNIPIEHSKTSDIEICF